MNEDEQEKKLEQELRDGLNSEEPYSNSTDSKEVKTKKDKPEEATTHNSPGTVILQWLSYAFWAWLVISLVWLIDRVLSSGLLDQNVSSTIPYALAASIVMLPVAFFVDLFYRKHEPTKKTGAAMVIMVIHSVLFALVTIGTLIGAVFILLDMFISGTLSSNDPSAVTLYTTLFAAIAFGFVFLRTLNPFKTKKLAKMFGYAMLAVSSTLIVLGLIGPALSSYNLRNDRLIEEGIGSVSSAIDSYTNANSALPESLDDVSFKTKISKDLIEKDLLTYKPEGQVENDNNDSRYETYHYQLCANYTKPAANQDPYYEYGSSYDEPEYQPHPNTYAHDAGEVCYKLSTKFYNPVEKTEE